MAINAIAAVTRSWRARSLAVAIVSLRKGGSVFETHDETTSQLGVLHYVVGNTAAASNRASDTGQCNAGLHEYLVHFRLFVYTLSV